MQSLSQLLQPQVAAHTPLTSLMQPDGIDVRYSLRLFNIISDLAVIKAWVRDPDKRSNWTEAPDFPTIFRYNALLESHRAQSFMILQDNIQRFQADLTLTADGLQIEYLFAAHFRFPHIMSAGLLLLNRYIDRFDVPEKRLINVPALTPDVGKEVERAGFIFSEKAFDSPSLIQYIL